jgi:uncharacterized protein (DUF1800 family)
MNTSIIGGAIALALLLTGNASAQVGITPQAASRFLAQATFGPNTTAIDDVSANGPRAWLSAQFDKPQTPAFLNYALAQSAVSTTAVQNQFHEIFWKQAATADDQLRQRVTFALSEIFVISMQDMTVGGHSRGVADYYDTLNRNAFGNFRTLLEQVTLHPMMGAYLTYLRNQKESDDQVRLPDENYAREVMQLFTIGLYQLTPDGVEITDNNGQKIETYKHEDILGLAKVLTGWSFGNANSTTDYFLGTKRDADWDIKPMRNYPLYHSTSTKSFLGVTISGATTGEADLKVALDTLFNHPNVGPFIGRQLIQRLVTSNPSHEYIGRVAAAFADNGIGVRGDMKAVITAVLMDPEARAMGDTNKVREPIVRLANWMRAFNAQSKSGKFLLGYLDDPIFGLGETPMRSPSVFNFYRPGYTPPKTDLAEAGLVAPEMQITAEPSVAGYLNYMQNVVPDGAGTNQDIQPNYAEELALTAYPEQLVDRINLLLLNGSMSDALKTKIVNAVKSIEPAPAPNGTNAARIELLKKYRVCAAIYLAMSSPEYIVQK